MAKLKISDNFYLDEFLVSDKAKALGVEKIQKNPPDEIKKSLSYLITKTVQPVRTFLAFTFKVNSGWRCKVVNDAAGSTDASQHLKGEAADLDIDDAMLSSKSKVTQHAIKELNTRIERVTGKKPRSDVNANYYLWAYYCLHLNEMDIDQVIHEYGSDGKPSWIHVASSVTKNRRRITVKRSGKSYEDVDLKTALMMGC